MGRGIAVTCAAAGFEVLVPDRTAELTRRCLVEISEDLDRDIPKWSRTDRRRSDPWVAFERSRF
jgi:3-hydroxyacyl-CoA dehydrogenase